MSRFSNLELNSEFEESSNTESVIKDEGYYLGEAKSAFESGRFERGLRAYAKVLEFNPRNTTAWTGQVRMLIELGEFREAKLWADKALETFSNESELLAAKAVALGRLGDLKAALAFSDASIEERGNTPYIWLARGDVLLARKEKRAEYSFNKALLLAPNDWFFPWLISRVHFFYKKFSVALKMAQLALSVDGSRGVIWLQLGRSQQALGLAGMAVNSFEQVRQLDPACFEAEAELTRLSRPGLAARLRNYWRELFHR